MSYDLYLYKHCFDHGDPAAPYPAALGVRRELVRRLLPTLEFNRRRSAAYLLAPAYSIRFGLGRATFPEAIEVRLRGSGEALSVVRALCASTGWAAYDAQAGAFLTEAVATANGAWQQFQQRRHDATSGRP